MPSRTYNILAAGKPILALTDPDSEIAQVIGEEQVGWAVRPGDSGLLSDTIREIYSQQDVLETMGANARNAALTKYALSVAIEKYRSELD